MNAEQDKGGGDRAAERPQVQPSRSAWQPNPAAKAARRRSEAGWQAGGEASAAGGRAGWARRDLRRPAAFAPSTAPVLTIRALLYPWATGNWAPWLGLALMYMAGVLLLRWAIVITIMLARLLGFIGVLTFGSVVLVSFALFCYAAHVFVEVVQQTACGSDRLERLPGFDWYELLPSGLTVFFAAGCALVPASLFTYWCYATLRLSDLAATLLAAAAMLVLFPLFFLASMAGGSVLPLAGLGVTVRAIVRQAGAALAVLLASASVASAAIAAIYGAYAASRWLGHLSLGPIMITAMMIYGHLLGRLARRMMESEEDERD